MPDSVAGADARTVRKVERVADDVRIWPIW